MRAGLDRREVLGLLGALSLVVVATAGKHDNGLVWDDLYVIERGEVIHDPRNLPALFAHRTMYVSSAPDASERAASGLDTYRPVTLATFVWDSALSGRDPWAYHLTNLLLHLGCVALVFLLARRLLRPSSRPFVAPFVAAFFGVTPLLAEAHVWINGRSDPACTLFGLGAILLWRRALEAAPGRRAALLFAAAFTFLLGLLSKEVLLFAVPALVLWPEQEPRGLRSRTLRAAPFAVASAVYLGARSLALSGLRSHAGTGQLAEAALALPSLLLDGLAELVIPTRVYVRSLSDDYHVLGPVVLAALALPVAALAVLAVRARKAEPVLAWSALLFASTLAPAALIATLLWPGFGRYLYLPAVGVALALGVALGRALRHPALADHVGRRRLLAGAALLYLGVLAARLHAWVPDWHDEETLYRSIVDAAPDSPHGHGWLGMTYLEEGDAARAIPHLAQADRLAPYQPRYLRQLGWALAASGDVQGSLDVAATGLRRYDGLPDFHHLAAHDLETTHPELASSHLRACLERAPSHPGCLELAARLCADPARGPTYRALLGAGGPGGAALAPLCGAAAR